MTAILYSEGLRDLGDPDPFGDPFGHAAGDEHRQGPLRHLIADVLGHPDGLVIESRNLGRVHGSRETHGMSPFARKVYRAIRDVERDDDDGIVVVIDRDGERGKDRLQQLRDGRDQARSQDRERDRGSLPCALGVAQEMVESWLLGDPGAWIRAFGDDAPRPPDDPEISTGPRSSQHYAKRVLEQLLTVVNASPNVAGYTEVASFIRTSELERRCPRSFAPVCCRAAGGDGTNLYRQTG